MTTASFDISIINDNIFEGNEDIKVEIIGSSLSNEIVVSDPDQATVTIVDDESSSI